MTGKADPSKAHEHPGSKFNPNSTFLGDRAFHSPVYADDGGASRFFPQFSGSPGSAPVTFYYTTKASESEVTLNGRAPSTHPTRKPLAMMRHLIRESGVEEGSVVLDPYAGSGSTLHAALELGMKTVGVEKYEVSHREASRRLEIVQEELDAERGEKDVFDAMFGD